MANDAHEGYAFIVLLNDEDDSLGLSRLLDDVKLPEATVPAVFLSPPVRGQSFFADEAKQGETDAWWEQNVPPNARPVYMLEHEPNLIDWIDGLDGTFYIGVGSVEEGAVYEKQTEIKSFIAHGPLDFATIIMREFSGGNGSGDLIFDQGEAIRMAALSADFPIDFDDSDFYPDADPASGNGFTPIPREDVPGQPSYGNQPYTPAAAGASQYTPGPPPPPPKPVIQQAPPATPNPFDLLSGGGMVGGNAPQPVRDYGSSAQSPQNQPALPPPMAPRQQSPSPSPSPFPPSQAPPPGTRNNQPMYTPPPAPSQGPGPAEWSPNDPLIPPGALNPYQPPGTMDPVPPWQNGGAQGVPGAQGPGIVMPGAANGGYGQQTDPKKKQSPLSSLFTFKKAPKGSKGGYRESPNAELAQWMVQRGGTIVVMGSRKGGVGKTSFAAAVAIVAGTVLDATGHKAAIVDANIANPDAWGQLNLPPGAATVRETVAALTTNREPPAPVYASTPALACFPEDRETSEYSKTDVRRLADYLKRRYTFIVVDMSNRLPDPMAGPEAAAAAYWLELADVLVLPTTSSKQDFNGVLDYLDVRDLPPTVVPYIVPHAKKNREHPATQQYLNLIRGRVQAIVEIPDEADTVRLAGMQGVPVEQISPLLRAAYRELTEVVVRSPQRQRRR